MSKMVAVLLAMVLIFCLGCSKSSTQSAPSLWTVQQIWPRGSHPVPSPTSNAILFMQEESPAGLYLLSNGAATLINPSGPDARADYAWSNDGTRFCFSAPGAPGGANAGIYLGHPDAPTALTRLWDRGSHPRFLPGTGGIVCAGPEDSTGNSDIVQIPLSGTEPTPLSIRGTSPEVSPDGSRIAYLVPGGIEGRTLVVANVETTARDTVAGRVLVYYWLGDSRTLVYGSTTNGNPSISTASVSGAPTTIGGGAAPAPFPQGNGFVFTALSGDRLDGLFTAAPGQSPVRITHSGTMAIPASGNRIVAQDTTGLLEITH
ncbi:MAG TPA: hypothetical protein VGL38_04020 [bacterium]|jgi:hypothetical protein